MINEKVCEKVLKTELIVGKSTQKCKKIYKIHQIIVEKYENLDILL